MKGRRILNNWGWNSPDVFEKLWRISAFLPAHLLTVCRFLLDADAEEHSQSGKETENTQTCNRKKFHFWRQNFFLVDFFWRFERTSRSTWNEEKARKKKVTFAEKAAGMDELVFEAFVNDHAMYDTYSWYNSLWRLSCLVWFGFGQQL